MSPKMDPHSTTQSAKTQTPFDRFKDALSVVVSVPKSVVLKAPKKSTTRKK